MGQRAASLIPKDFFKKNKIDENASPQVILFLYNNDLILSPETNIPDWKIQPGEEALEAEIQKCTDAKQLVKYMRRPMSEPCHAVLIKRALLLEQEVLPLAEDLALRSVQDEFLDSFVEFVLYTRKNPSPWIMEHYSEIRSDFLRSQLCVVLGLRGTPKYIPFLLEEVDHLKGKDPSDPLEQGPIVALSILRKWPDDEEDWEPKDDVSNSMASVSLDVDEEDLNLSPEELTRKMQEDPRYAQQIMEQMRKIFTEKKKAILELQKQGLNTEQIAAHEGLPAEAVEKLLSMPDHPENAQ